jgi:sugar phosphate permease
MGASLQHKYWAGCGARESQLLMLCCAGCCVQGVTSWFVFYLIKEKGVADAAQAAVRVSGLELGGLVGSLIAGRLSDMMINNSKKGEGAVGKRVQVGAPCAGVWTVTSLLIWRWVLLGQCLHYAGLHPQGGSGNRSQRAQVT